jgi:hypothetical protein
MSCIASANQIQLFESPLTMSVQAPAMPPEREEVPESKFSGVVDKKRSASWGQVLMLDASRSSAIIGVFWRYNIGRKSCPGTAVRRWAARVELESVIRY